MLIQLFVNGIIAASIYALVGLGFAFNIFSVVLFDKTNLNQRRLS